MRRLLTGLVVAATTALIPMLAWASNQETADQIVQQLKSSGQLTDYKIGVRYQEGTAYLTGRVTSEEQRDAALKIAAKTPGVTKVINEMTIGNSDSQAAAPVASQTDNPLRYGQTASAPKPGLAQRLESALSNNSEAKAAQTLPQAQRVPNSFTAAKVAPVSAEEAVYEPNQVPTQIAKPMAASRRTQQVAMQPSSQQGMMASNGAPLPMYTASANNAAPARYDQPCLPNYAWPSYAAYPNYAAVTYPKQYSATAWPYIGPFYP